MNASAFANRVRSLKRETHALYFAARHAATPWYAKLVIAGVVAYALSPIDLIPDFVPVLGYLDDLILLPIGILVAIKMVPTDVLDECRCKADEASASRAPVNRVAAAAIIGIWLFAGALCAWWAYDAFMASSGRAG